MDKKKVVFLGDSITVGYGLEDPKYRYSTVFCEMAGCEELNYGTTGTLIARAGVSIPNGRAFIDRYEEMADGDLVVVFGCSNDYWWSDMGIGDKNSTDVAYYHCALRTLCQGLKDKYGDTPIMFVIPYQQRGYGNFYGGKDFMDARPHDTNSLNYLGNPFRPYCDLVREICARYDIPTLDLYYNSDMDIPGSDEDNERYTLDGCHPTIAGHKLLAEKLYEFVMVNKLL
jgi:lysophospholipase L1-like esterase